MLGWGMGDRGTGYGVWGLGDRVSGYFERPPLLLVAMFVREREKGRDEGFPLL